MCLSIDTKTLNFTFFKCIKRLNFEKSYANRRRPPCIINNLIVPLIVSLTCKSGEERQIVCKTFYEFFFP